ncbi:MAG TPA: DUF3500 domain-containing protein [Acidimicrobiales bacterium]|nr:DUF3500 domain-containing protein [Acidimicrobiales bacterium]
MALADDLAAAVRRLLDGLDQGQRALASIPFHDADRHTWAYWPTDRKGLPVHLLDRAGTKEVHRCLSTVLTPTAFAKAVAIMGLDEVLDLREGHAWDRRHRDDYWITVFGTPGEAPWGWRFEGHHVSIHATVAGDEVTMVPLFLGANPGEVRDADRVVVAPLAAEESLGFELLHALTVEQRADAIVADSAPDDILTRNDPRIDASLAEEGIPLAALGGAAAAAADALLANYLGRFPAGARGPDPVGARFAWAGADEPGAGHYHRLAGPRVLVELDNTQDGANHVHTVVRDPQADFAYDVLAAHHRSAHGPA